jgi:Tfp pilus assembly protein PilV
MDTLVTFRTFFRGVARNEDGLTLIEVVITTLFVALIVVGTLTGFQDISRTSADERFHNEATLLAAQSQEQLRSDPASTLNAINGASNHSHTYTVPIEKNTYTITQEATYFNESKPGSDCLATAASESSSKNDGAYLRVTSRVTWPQISTKGREREPVTESSIITPPDGSALEVDATNDGYPEAAVSGVTSVVKYTGVEATEPTPLEGTTGTAGCVVFGGIPATSAKVEIKEIPGYVTTSGAIKVPAKEVTIAPNITTHDPVVLNEGGAIKATFTYSGKEVSGDTFVAYFEEVVNPSIEYTVGDTEFEYETGGEHKYKPLTKETQYNTYATTPMGTGYSKGDLFPFPYPSLSNKKWTVFAGDCKENNAHTSDSEVEDAKAIVTRGNTTSISVPMADLILNVYPGKSSEKKPLYTVAEKVKITNTACESAPVPSNASAVNLVHEQSLASGHLTYQYQPFGKAKLCIVGESTTSGSPAKTTYHTQTIEYNLNKLTHTDVIYLGEEAAKYTPAGGEDEVTVASSKTKLAC